jgi:hypothetical protein
MAAALIATCLLFAALLPLARQVLRDIALPSLRVDVGFFSLAPISPDDGTTAAFAPSADRASRDNFSESLH